jgi:hypothetical protein
LEKLEKLEKLEEAKQLSVGEEKVKSPEMKKTSPTPIRRSAPCPRGELTSWCASPCRLATTGR